MNSNKNINYIMNNLTAFYKKNYVEHTYKNTFELYKFFNKLINHSLIIIKNYKKDHNMTKKQIVKHCKRELNTLSIKFSNDIILTTPEECSWTVYVQVLIILNEFDRTDINNGLYFYKK